MKASSLKKIADAVPSFRKRNAMKYAETVNLDKFYIALEAAAANGKYSATLYTIQLIEDGYFTPNDDFDQKHFLLLFANKLESAIEGLNTQVIDGGINISWGA